MGVNIVRPNDRRRLASRGRLLIHTISQSLVNLLLPSGSLELQAAKVSFNRRLRRKSQDIRTYAA